MSGLDGDPGAIRAGAAQLRRRAEEIECALCCLDAPLQMPDNVSDFADRARDATILMRGRGASVAERLRTHAAELDLVAQDLDVRRAATGW